MTHILDNPFWNALNTRQSYLSEGNDVVKRYYPAVSPIAGAVEYKPITYAELVRLTVPGDKIMIAGIEASPSHPNLDVRHYLPCVQMIYEGDGRLQEAPDDDVEIVTLTTENVPEMLELIKIARPGPFAARTIEMGNYYGIFQDDQLAAVAGERAHLDGFAEVSAVCTRPGYEGRGYASRLVKRVMRGILTKNEIPFLHVVVENERAISVYERLGFYKRIDINAAFIQRI